MYVDILQAHVSAVDIVQSLNNLPQGQALPHAPYQRDRAERELALEVSLRHADEVLAHHEFRGQIARVAELARVRVLDAKRVGVRYQVTPGLEFS